MAKLQLHEISERLLAATDVDGVVDPLLAYLRAVQADWHPSLALYDARRELLTGVYTRERGQLERRDVTLPVDQLPARLVRNYFRPSAFFNGPDRRTLLARVFQSGPAFEAGPQDAIGLQPLAAIHGWASGACLPLADQDDLLGLLVLTSPRKAAFAAAELRELVPVRCLASLAIARRLHALGRPTPEMRAAEEGARRAGQAFHERLQQIEAEAAVLASDNQLKAQRLEALSRELDAMRERSAAGGEEVEQMRVRLRAIEEQGLAAGQHLHDAYAQLAAAQSRHAETQRTFRFLAEVFQAAAGEHDSEALTRDLVTRFCDHFEVERCSLMRVDTGHERLRIAAHRGMDPAVAGRVSLPLGQGVAGWVAHHRTPVLVRERGDAAPVAATGVDAYNSDSFISVPLVHRNRMLGVLNLSNKRDGEAFSELDLERALLAGAVLSLNLGRAAGAAGPPDAPGSGHIEVQP